MHIKFSMRIFDDPHLRDEVNAIHKVLDRHGVKFDLFPLSTMFKWKWSLTMSSVEGFRTGLTKSNQRVSIDGDAS